MAQETDDEILAVIQIQEFLKDFFIIVLISHIGDFGPWSRLNTAEVPLSVHISNVRFKGLGSKCVNWTHSFLDTEAS